ncbi:MAG: type II toxin-antitoxin system prevent-host-death family antitoxin [Gemmatimonadetes bacterium]|nr:type II toxin-antitoxin system prevent-host-death family antitoxin [Gemmatimonadota bacterium]MBL0178498.1 type II toxin-antitoxin system prevent-host-death family antitoxin [Gemmatimonadota bacterium]
MPEEYSIYDAKAKLSALVRQVREGRSFVITVHGQPVAELRPIEPKPKATTLAARVAELRAKGLITPARTTPDDPRAFPIGEYREGALQRFLDDRD